MSSNIHNYPRRSMIMSAAVEQYCDDCGIVEIQERGYVTEIVNSLFDLGTIRPEALRQGLEDVMGKAHPFRLTLS